MAKVPDPTPAPILLLCDWAEAINGKLYMQGAGIDRVAAGRPFPLAVAVQLFVGWNQLNEKQTVELNLTKDGAPYPVEAPLQAKWEIEIGRPPGIVHGSVLSAPFALKIALIQFEEGRYDLSLSVNGDPRATLAFQAMGGQP